MKQDLREQLGQEITSLGTFHIKYSNAGGRTWTSEDSNQVYFLLLAGTITYFGIKRKTSPPHQSHLVDAPNHIKGTKKELALRNPIV